MLRSKRKETKIGAEAVCVCGGGEVEGIGHVSLLSSAVGDPQVLTSPWQLLDLCFPLWLCRQDEGTFVANTAKCGPAAGSLPGMINSCSEQMNKTLQCWRGAVHMGRRGQRVGNWNLALVVGKSLEAPTRHTERVPAMRQLPSWVLGAFPVKNHKHIHCLWG